jgi:hypothetical protein
MTLDVRRSISLELSWDCWIAPTAIDPAPPQAGLTVAEAGISTELPNHKAPALEWESWAALSAIVSSLAPGIRLTQAEVGLSSSRIADLKELPAETQPKPATLQAKAEAA